MKADHSAGALCRSHSVCARIATAGSACLHAEIDRLCSSSRTTDSRRLRSNSEYAGVTPFVGAALTSVRLQNIQSGSIFNCHQFPDSYIFATRTNLIIGQINELQKLDVRTVRKSSMTGTRLNRECRSHLDWIRLSGLHITAVYVLMGLFVTGTS